MKNKERKNRTTISSRSNRIFPIRNAFTFARDLARKYSWPKFVFDGKSYTPYAAIQKE